MDDIITSTGVSPKTRFAAPDREKKLFSGVMAIQKRMQRDGFFSLTHLQSSTIANVMRPQERRPVLSDAEVQDMVDS